MEAPKSKSQRKREKLKARMAQQPKMEPVPPEIKSENIPPVIQPIQNACAVCKEPGDKCCSSCKNVYYCSVGHQKQDWKLHQKTCPPFNIVYDDILGNEWITNRPIKAGTILLDEEPSLFGPQWTQPTFHSGIPNCLTCGLYMEDNPRSRCDTCNWPVCSPACAKMSIHSLNECKIFAAKKIQFPPSFEFPPSDLCLCITWLRGAGLKENDLKNYEKVMTSQHYFVGDENNKALDEAAEEVISKLKILIGPDLERPEEDYKRIARVKKVNAFAGSLYPNIINTYSNDAVPSSYLCVIAAKANHSCAPNCTWSLGGLLPPNLRIRIRATLDVPKGEKLTISYRPSDIQFGTTERQSALRNGYGFICQCPRCIDPTECGSFVSAVKCPECLVKSPIKSSDPNSGYFLPEDPLNLEPEAMWRCNSCGVRQQSKEMMPIVTLLEKEFERQKIIFETTNDMDRKNMALIYEEFIQEHKTLLHPNHWIFQKVAMEIIVCHRSLKNLMNRKELENSIRYFEYRLNIQDKCMPGISAERAMTFRYLKDVLLTFLARFNSTMTPAEIRHWGDYCKKVLTEAMNFYKNDINPQHLMQKPKPTNLKLAEDLKLLEKNVQLSLLMSSYKSNNG